MEEVTPREHTNAVVDGDGVEEMMDLDSAQTIGKKRNRRKERSRKKK